MLTIKVHVVLALFYVKFKFQPSSTSGVPIPTDTFYNSNFNGKTTFSTNYLVCMICIKYTFIILLPMHYQSFYILEVNKITPIVIILDHILQVPHI